MGTYRPVFIGRGCFLAIFGALGLATVALIVMAATGESISLPFVLFWIVAFAWNAYWWLFRVVFSLTLRDGDLEWEAPLRRGRIPTDDVTSLGPAALVPSLLLLKHAGGGPSLLVVQGKGFADFASALLEARPDLDVRAGALGRMADRGPGPSAWRGND